MIRRTRNNQLPEQYRQGDVFLIAKTIPSYAMRQPNLQTLILERGEVTGHAHAFNDTRSVSLYTHSDKRFLDAREESQLSHEEHDSLAIPKNTYEVRRQRTWSVLSDTVVRLAD